MWDNEICKKRKVCVESEDMYILVALNCMGNGEWPYRIMSLRVPHEITILHLIPLPNHTSQNQHSFVRCHDSYTSHGFIGFDRGKPAIPD